MNSIEKTILFADLSGFTALTETHGDQDAVEVVARFYDLAQAMLTEEARLVKTIGDAVMIAASQPSVGVLAALRMVAAVQAEPGFPTVRVGIHVGPCIERAGDYIGAAVNLAARIAAYARSDQILCTVPVADAIRPLQIAAIRPAGATRFKNVTEAVTLFEIEDPRRIVTHGEIDPVCRMQLDPECAPARLPFGDRAYHFCSFDCAQKFAKTPETYIRI